MDKNDDFEFDEDQNLAMRVRACQEQLADQMHRILDDPCVKVLFEAVTGFVLILNKNRQILAANREFLDSFERSGPGRVIGLRPGEALNCIHCREGADGCGTSKHCRSCGSMLAILAAQVNGQPTEGEWRVSHCREGKLEVLDFKVRATPFEICGCKLTAFVFQDISALKRREVLEQIFLHDFLNTIGGIAGWGELLKEADQYTAAREIAALAESLKEEVITQRTLLAAERGELMAKRQQFDVGDLAARLELIFTRHAIARGKILSIGPMPSRTQVVSDEVLLMRVLVNMLKNAFEATEPNGRVDFWFEWRGEAPTFVVRNAGIMAEFVQSRLFESSFSTRSHECRGIGTSSMKLYGERYLGGTVSFTSDEENGTQFFISLPSQKPSDHVDASHRATGTETTFSVLLVDDDEALLRLGMRILTRAGYSITACRTPIEALDIFTAAPNSFDAVITDYMMPKMDGIELARHLAEIRRDIPVLLCTGIGETAITIPGNIGIDGCIAKPFTFQQLADSLKHVISGVASRKLTG